MMKTAVSYQLTDEETEIREAARDAARRDGVSLGEWLDGVMSQRAKALGMDVSTLPPTQRVHAVMKGLGWSREAADSGTSTGPARPTDIEDDGVAIVAQMSKPIPEPRPEAGQGAMRDPDPRPAQETRREEERIASRQAAQRVQIETKLNALFNALAKPVRRTDHPTSAMAGSGAPAGDDARMQSLLGETAISPSWRLEKAVAEIAERQMFLEQQATVEKPARQSAPDRFGNPAAAAADLRERYGWPVADETTALSVEQDAAWLAAEAAGTAAVDHAEAAPAQPTPEPVPSIFTSLQGDTDRLAKRLDAVHLDASRRPAERGRETSFDQIRALLEEMRPDPSIDNLGRHVEALSQKLDKVMDRRAPADAIARLSQRIEDVHADLAARLAAQATAPAIDMAAIEQMIHDVVARSPGHSGDDLRGLEEAVHQLAAKLESAERSQVDAALLTDLQAQVGTLAERIDRSDAGVSTIIAMERSLGELFAQVGNLRTVTVEAAEVAARTVAEEAVHKAQAEAAFAPPPAAIADPAVEQVTRELVEMRVARGEADVRLHAILAALNGSLERVVDRLGALEDEVATGAPSLVAGGSEFPPVGDANAQTRAGVTEPEARAAAPEVGAVIVEPEPRAAEPDAEPLDLSSHSLIQPTPVDLDRPIEPGTGAPRARVDAKPMDGSAVSPDPTSFIAAARRAAQTAALDQAGRVEPASLARVRGASKAKPASTLSQAKGAVASKRRPLLLALASLVLLMGAAQIVRLSLKPSGDEASSADIAAVNAPSTAGADTAAVPAQTATVAPAASGASGPAEAASAPASAPAASPPVIAAAPAEPAAPSKALPTLAMGPAASIAAAQVAENAAKSAPGAGLPAGLREAAVDGRPDAQYEVGLRYADGRGVTRDLKVAASWFEKAAKQGLAPAGYRLGSLYERGLGVSRDAAQALAWYGKAADAGNIRAAHNLAVMLAEGAAGKPDYAAAASWFTKAAEAGIKDSQYNLAILYARGLGIEQNFAHSYTWFTIAAAQGDTDSAKKREDVAGKLDAAALAAAKAAAEAFKPVPAAAASNEVQAPQGGWDALAPAHPSTSQLAPAKGPARLM